MLFLVLRITLFFLLVSTFAVGLSWFNTMSGDMRIEFGDHEYIMNPLLLVGAVVAIFAVLLLIVMLVRLVISGPSALTGYFSHRRQSKGMDALLRSLQNSAVGEGTAALRNAQDAHRLLHQPDLTLLLMAQTAQSAQEATLAHKAFEKLTHQPETEIIGLKGLLEHAKSEGDLTQALTYARRAYAIAPKTPWVLEALFTLYIQQEDWGSALETLSQKRRFRHLNKPEADQVEAVLRLARAQQDMARGSSETAFVDAMKALKLAPDMVPAAVMAARFLVFEGKTRKAERLLRDAWGHLPHPDLLQAYREIYPQETAEKRQKRFQKLFLAAPEALETKLASVELDILNEDFPKARDKLAPLLLETPTARICALQAVIVKGLGEDEAVVRAWLTRALSAPMGMHWQCKACADISPNWCPVCPECGAFNTIRWTYVDSAAMVSSDALTPLIEAPVRRALEE